MSLAKIEEHVGLYTRATDFVVWAWFSLGVPEYVLDWGIYFPNLSDSLSGAKWVDFLKNKGIQTLLATAVFLIYDNSRKNAQKETEIMRSMFSKEGTPENWDLVYGNRQLVLYVFALGLISIVLTLTIEDVRLFSAAICVYAAANVVGIVLHRRNVIKCVNSERFMPDGNDEHRRMILENREIQLGYLNRNHHAKEGVLFAAGAAALLLTGSGLAQAGAWGPLPGWILIVALFASETAVSVWRYRRNRDLEKVADRHAAVAQAEAHS